VHLAATDIELVDGFRWGLRRRVRPDDTTLESAAAVMTTMVYDALGAAVLMARTFAVLPFAALPPVERAFAEAHAHKHGDDDLEPGTQIITLMASRGTERCWNDRRSSRSHLAVPLLSKAHRLATPMVDLFASDARSFYVFDASTTTDERGRYTIPERQFVRDNDVRTVLGVGEKRGDVPFALILFARQHVTRRVAEELEPLAEEFSALTARAVAQRRLFDA
jgi:hypothetical protein